MAPSVRPIVDPLDEAWQRAQASSALHAPDALDSAWQAAQPPIQRVDPIEAAWTSANPNARLEEDAAEHAPPPVEITEPALHGAPVEFQPDDPAARIRRESEELRNATALRTAAPAESTQPGGPPPIATGADVTTRRQTRDLVRPVRPVKPFTPEPPPAPLIRPGTVAKAMDEPASTKNEDTLVQRLSRDIAPMNEASAEEGARPTTPMGKAADAAGQMLAHPIGTAVGIATAVPAAGLLLGKFAAQEDRKSRGEWEGADVVSPRQAAFAAGQLLATGAAEAVLPALDRLFGAGMARAALTARRAGKSPAQALLAGYAARTATHAAAGAGLGAVFSPDDPEMGALLGAAIGGVHAATQLPWLRLPAEEVPMNAAEAVPPERQLAAPKKAKTAPAMAAIDEEEFEHPDKGGPDYVVKGPKGTPPDVGHVGAEPGPRRFPVTASTLKDLAHERGLSIEDAAAKLREADYTVEDDIVTTAGGDPARIPAPRPYLVDWNETRMGPKPTRAEYEAFKRGAVETLLPKLEKEKPATADAQGQELPMSMHPAAEEMAADKKAAAEKPKYDYSSTQLDLPPEHAAAIHELAAKIPDDALNTEAGGRETEPHITVKYGLHTEEADKVRALLADQPPITVKLGKTSIFPADEKAVQRGGADVSDVVKVDVDSPELHALNKKIADALPHTDTFPEYKPHATVAYVKPGLGKQFAGDASAEGRTMTFDRLTFSGKDGKKVEIPLAGTAKSADVGTAPATTSNPTAPEHHFRDLLDKSHEELRQIADQETARENNLETEIFGAEDAKRYAALQRRANSINLSHDVTHAASAEIEAMEAKLTPEQQNRLFGIGQKGLNSEELRDAARDALSYAPHNTADMSDHDLMSTVGRELTTGSPEKNLSHAMRLRGAVAELAKRTGKSTEEIIKAGLEERVRAGHASANDAIALFASKMKALREAGLFSEVAPVASLPAGDTIQDGRSPAVQREEGTATPETGDAGAVRPSTVRESAEARPGDEAAEAAPASASDAEPGPSDLKQRPAIAGTDGARGETFLSTGQKIATKYRLVEADDVQPSHNPESFAANPAYPAGVQGREYAGKRGEAARSQVMTGALRPEVVLDRGSGTTDGPPVVTHHGIVVAGNDRSMRILRAAKLSPEQYAIYRKELAARAGDFGLDASKVAEMRKPVLVRQIDDPSIDVNDPAALGALNRASDTAPTKTKDQVTAAMSRVTAMRGANAALTHLAETMDPTSTVRDYLSTPAGRDFVRELVVDGVIATQELPAFVDRASNAIHAEGKQKLEDMLYAAAIGDADVMSRAPATVLRKIGPAVPAIVSANQIPEYSLEKALQGALDIHAGAAAMRSDIGSGKRSVADFLGQGDIFDRAHDPEAARLALYLESHSAPEVSEVFRTYALAARSASRALQSHDVFGHEPEKAPAIMDRLIAGEKRGGGRGGSRLGFPAPRGNAGPDLFGERPSPVSEQAGLFSDKAGTEASRPLKNAERAAQGEIERLREVVKASEDPITKAKASARIAALEKLVNRDKKISGDELKTQAAAEPDLDAHDDVDAHGDVVDDEKGGDLFGQPDSLRDDNFGTPIEYAMGGELKRPVHQEGKPVSAPEIIYALGDVTEAAGKRIAQRIGHMGPSGRNALGWWNPHVQVIRTRSANNISTAAHEVAHAVETLIYGHVKGSPWKRPLASTAMQRELMAMGKALYGSQKPAGGYKREGWAEYVRQWITESDHAGNDVDVKQLAPAVDAWFENEFAKDYPEIRAAFETARDLTRKWRKQGSYNRAAASMVDEGTLAARVRDAGRTIRHYVSMEKLVEMAQPLAELARGAESNLGRELKPSEDPFFTMSALRTTHDARTRYMVETGMIDLAGNIVGPALNDISGIVAGKRQDFSIYLWARRAVALWTDPKGRRNPGLALKDAQQILDELTTPAFELAAQKVYAWTNQTLDYAAEASPTFAEVVKATRARDPGDYVPLAREFAELDDIWTRSAGSGGATVRSPVKRLKGSGRRVKDIFPVLIGQTSKLLRQAHQRVILDQIIKLSNIEGMGNLVEEIPPDQVPAASAQIGEVIDKINQKIFESDPSAKLIDARHVDTDVLGGAITFFAPAQRPSGQDPIIPIYDQGKVRWFHVDGKLYDTLNALDVYRLPDTYKILEWGLGKPAEAFRAGTTGLRASFGLIWNPLRDVQTMMVNTRSKQLGAVVFAQWARAMGEMATSRIAGKNSEWVDVWTRLGGEMAQPLGQDIPHTRRAARRLFESRTTRTLDPRNWFDFYRDLVQFPEGAPRVAELRLLADEMGWKPGMPMTLDQSLQLLLASKQVTTDFTAAGEIARVVNRMVPFHNAAIQGPRATIRAAQRNPGLVAWRLAQMAAVTLLLWWKNKDEEWWTSMDYRERFQAWHFPITLGGRDELIRLPRAFDIGMVGAALPEMAMDAWYRADPKAATEWMKQFISVMAPDVVPVMPRVAFEEARNRQYPDRPIVPAADAAKPAEEQFNEYTTRVAVELGHIFNVSPERIDHVIQGTLGPVSGDLLSLLGLGAAGVEREHEKSDIPLVGRMFQRGGQLGYQPRQIRDLYDELEQAQLRQHSTEHPETPEQRKARLQMSDAADAVSAYLNVRRYSSTVAERTALTAAAKNVAEKALADNAQGANNRRTYARLRAQAERAKRTGRPMPESPR